MSEEEIQLINLASTLITILVVLLFFYFMTRKFKRKVGESRGLSKIYSFMIYLVLLIFVVLVTVVGLKITHDGVSSSVEGIIEKQT